MLYSYVIVNLIVTLGLSALVLLNSRQHPARRAFLFYLASMLIWNAYLTGGGITLHKAFGLYWYLFGLFATTLLHGFVLLGFCVQFPTSTIGSRWHRGLLVLLAACAIWLVTIGGITWISSGILRFYGMQYWIISCLIVAIAYLCWHLRIIRGQERLQTGYLLIGLGCALCAYLWTVYLHPTDIMNLVTSHNLLLIYIFPFLATYALLWSPLIGFNYIIRSATINGITIILLSSLLALLLYIVNGIVCFVFSFSYHWLYFVAIVLFAVMFHPCRNGVKCVWKHLLKNSLPLRVDCLLQQAIQTCLTTVEPRVLIGILTQAVQKTMQTYSLVLLRPKGKGVWEKTSSLHQLDRVPECIANSDILIQFYQQHTVPVFTDILLQQHGESLNLGGQLQGWGVSLVQPVFTDGKITGLVLLGEKESGGAYTAEDLHFLQELCTHVILAMDRSDQYEELRTSADAIYANMKERQAEMVNTNDKAQQT
ncbi:MAG TPA: GAF domain-containing protein [Armatimonadota bacterium]|nr:GAF domain-containing protein [Armatimonadota bacterium]